MVHSGVLVVSSSIYSSSSLARGLYLLVHSLHPYFFLNQDFWWGDDVVSLVDLKESVSAVAWTTSHAHPRSHRSAHHCRALKSHLLQIPNSHIFQAAALMSSHYPLNRNQTSLALCFKPFASWFRIPIPNCSSALGKISKAFFLFQVKRMNFQIQMEWSIALYNKKTNSLLVLLHGRKAICSITTLCCKIVVVSSADRDEMQIGDGVLWAS